MARSGRRSAVRRRKSGSSNGQRELWSEGVRLSRSARAHASSSCWFRSRRGKPAFAARFASWAVFQSSTPRAPGARRADRIRWPEGFFLKLRPLRISQRDREAGSAFTPLAAWSSPANSGMLMSSFSATRRRMKTRCGSSLLCRQPPSGLGASAPRAKSRHQIDDKRGRHPEMGRRRTPRMPGLNVTHHTLAKIKRIGLRHRKSPPTGSESHSHPRWNPHRFNLTVRCSRQGGNNDSADHRSADRRGSRSDDGVHRRDLRALHRLRRRPPAGRGGDVEQRLVSARGVRRHQLHVELGLCGVRGDRLMDRRVPLDHGARTHPAPSAKHLTEAQWSRPRSGGWALGWAPVGQPAESSLRRPASSARAPNPASIIAQVEGSGVGKAEANTPRLLLSSRSTTPKLPLGLSIKSGLPPTPDWSNAVEPPPSRLRPSKTPRSIIRAASSEVVTPTLYPGWRPSIAIRYKKPARPRNRTHRGRAKKDGP